MDWVLHVIELQPSPHIYTPGSWQMLRARETNKIVSMPVKHHLAFTNK